MTQSLLEDSSWGCFSYPLGNRHPSGYVGFLDHDRGEVYAFCEQSGECCYGVGADGDVFAVDYRSVLWLPVKHCPDESCSIITAFSSGLEDDATPLRSLRQIDSGEALILLCVTRLNDCVCHGADRRQSVTRRALAWMFAVSIVMQQYVKHWDASSGFYYYENKQTGETQWHKPAILLGTRRRRGLAVSQVDVPEVCKISDSEKFEFDMCSWSQSDHDNLRKHTDAVQDPIYEAAQELTRSHNTMTILSGPYCARSGRGRDVKFAINALPQRSASLRHKPCVDQQRPLFLEDKEICPYSWRLGASVQCFDGYKVKLVSVEPYMLARGAAARGPLEVIDLMHRNNTRVDIVYFCLMAIAKMEFTEDENGLCTQEAKACILHTLCILRRQHENAVVVVAAMAALVQLADNYANRAVIAKENWCHLVVEKMYNLEFEYRVDVIQHTDRIEKTEIRLATHQSCDIAASGCRLFAAMASDIHSREQYAEAAIQCCAAVMRDCCDDATVQAAACECVYNFVYRCEVASIMADEHKVLDLVNVAIEKFATDNEFIAVALRARKTLEPDGWRGVDVEPLRTRFR